MSVASASAFSTWQVPPWADARSVDEDSVFHERHIGEFTPLDEGRPFKVDLIQRDCVDLLATPVTFTRDEAHIRVDGLQLSSAEVRLLAELLIRAADILEGSAG